MREFTDSEGVQWQAWEVIPSTAERRNSTADRRFGARDHHERRVKQQLRVKMDEGLAEGWLVFESAEEKRRLHPIPEAWESLSDEQLVELARSAGAASPVIRSAE